jgi:hypothetical protein
MHAGSAYGIDFFLRLAGYLHRLSELWGHSEAAFHIGLAAHLADYVFDERAFPILLIKFPSGSFATTKGAPFLSHGDKHCHK